MRLLDDEANQPVNRVWVYLTESEARTLSDQLVTHFEGGDPVSDWHAHVESDDGRSKELTLAIYDPAAPGNRSWREWFAEDRWTAAMFRNSEEHTE